MYLGQSERVILNLEGAYLDGPDAMATVTYQW
jgi:hypothetical protein